MVKPINKLVRDNIPEICKANGKNPKIKILDDAEYTLELQKKLEEEVAEYLSSKEIEELADILEVVEALAESQGASMEEIMHIKHRKQTKNGAFKSKVFLIQAED